MTTQIKLRRDTAANWTSANPTLGVGEVGLETDTRKAKFGDGATAWSGLSYMVAPDSSALTTATSFSGDAAGLYNALVVDRMSQDINFTGDATITDVGTLNDYALSGTVGVLRWNGASALALTGMQGGGDGRLIFLMNVTAAQTLTLSHDDVLSTAANRFYLEGAASLALPSFTAVALLYDSTSSRWRLVGGKSVAAHAAEADPHTGYLKEADIAAVGDLFVGSADNTVGILTKGTTGQHLITDTGEALDLKWESQTITIGCLINGGGSVISTGVHPVWRAPYACTVVAVRGYVDTGTTTVINAAKLGTGDFCSADITIDPADAWEAGTVNQNTALAAGDTVSVEVVTAGTATELTIQVEVTRP